MQYPLLKSRLFIGMALLLSFSFNLANAQGKVYSSLTDAIMENSILRGQSGPQDVNWINGGDQYSFITKREIHSYDPKTSKEDLVFASGGTNFPGSDRRFNYSSFQWSQDSKHIVFKTNTRQLFRRSDISDYYIYDLGTKQLKQAAKDARTAELSPDGSMVGIERGGNMYAYNFASATEQQLTSDSTSENGIFNGHFDWVYEEEFGQAQAWKWSPDSKYIAFWQFDEHQVPDFQMTNYDGPHPEYVHISIPLVGDSNPSVRIGVLDARSDKKIWLTPDETGDFYIPRIYWTNNPDVLALMTMNRAQNQMKLYFFNVKTGEHHVVLEEQNNTWVAIFQFYTGVNDLVCFPERSKEFFWVSDRSGYYHIYRYNYEGKLIGQVTKGDWDVIKITGINPDTKTIFYLSAEASPLEQQFYSIKFDGSKKTRLSQTAGFHDIDMAPNTQYYIDGYSNTTTPTRVDLNDETGKTLKTLEDNKGVAGFIKTHAYSPAELFRFKTTDGADLDGMMTKPFNFDPSKKYPVVLTIYGGPESHDVYNHFSASSWDQWLSQNGYIVIDVNNRGIANYGSKFTKIGYKQLGKWESNDFVETAKYLSRLPYVDSTKMGIMGTSYGGYSTIYTLLTHPGVFKAGIANSPVTDFRLYDNIYTERYMAPLKDNEEGYKKSSAITYAANLRDHLLLIAAPSDDNAHVINTMQLVTAFINANKDVDLRLYPRGAHGAAYSFPSYILIASEQFQYLERYVKGVGEQPTEHFRESLINH
jgi:dipeptidyl-peptidase-4